MHKINNNKLNLNRITNRVTLKRIRAKIREITNRTTSKSKTKIIRTLKKSKTKRRKKLSMTMMSVISQSHIQRSA